MNEHETIIVQSRNAATLPLLSTRLSTAVELIVRHLVFDHDQKQTIDYFNLYQDGLEYGSLISLVSLPRSDILSKSQSKLDHDVLKEALHPILKQVLRLDQSLFVDLCRDLSMVPIEGSRLAHWLTGLTEVHRHLLPISRILFEMEREMKMSTTLSQALVLVRDQVSLKQMGQGPALDSDGVAALNTALLNGILSQADMTSLSRMDIHKGPDSFVQWIKDASF